MPGGSGWEAPHRAQPISRRERADKTRASDRFLGRKLKLVRPRNEKVRSSGQPCQQTSMAMRVVMLRIMLSQQVLAIVVAIGRTYDGVNVVARGLIVIEDDARLVVELH